MSDESYIQVAVDGAGKKVRNTSLTTTQPDLSRSTVYMQVVQIADIDGNIIELRTAQIEKLLESLIEEIQGLRLAIEMQGGISF